MEVIDEIVGDCAHLLASSARSRAISRDIVEIRQQQRSENCDQPKGRTDRKDSGSRVWCRGLKVLFQDLRLLSLTAGSATIGGRGSCNLRAARDLHPEALNNATEKIYPPYMRAASALVSMPPRVMVK